MTQRSREETRILWPQSLISSWRYYFTIFLIEILSKKKRTTISESNPLSRSFMQQYHRNVIHRNRQTIQSTIIQASLRQQLSAWLMHSITFYSTRKCGPRYSAVSGKLPFNHVQNGVQQTSHFQIFSSILQFWNLVKQKTSLSSQRNFISNPISDKTPNEAI